MGETARAQLIRYALRSQDTNFASFLEPALSGLWILPSSYPKQPSLHKAPTASLEMISLTNLCNRLIVTSTRQTLNSQV
jgi:hypothetical protein